MKNPKDIFDGAFIGCYTLETINVEGSGYISIDGVLFLNGALLIQYPAWKKNETYEVPIHVAEISEYAFFGCKNLKKLTLTPHVKEIRLSTFIEDHDIQVKAKTACKFLQDGDKVKVSLRFRGREKDYTAKGREVMDKFAECCSEVSTIDKKPTFEGRSLTMFLAPKSDK